MNERKQDKKNREIILGDFVSLKRRRKRITIQKRESITKYKEQQTETDAVVIING